MDVSMVKHQSCDHEDIHSLCSSHRTELLLILLPDPSLPLIWREAADRGALPCVPAQPSDPELYREQVSDLAMSYH